MRNPPTRRWRAALAKAATICVGAAIWVLPGTSSRAESSVPALQLLGAFVAVKPSALGAEGGMGLLFHPIAGRELVLGPQVSALLARGSGRTRFDLNSGVEGTLWLVNAIGPGLALQVVAPSVISDEGAATHFRFVPQLSVRLKRFEEEGAWALRFGLPYDTHFKWGIQAGLTLQLDQVPAIGESATP